MSNKSDLPRWEHQAKEFQIGRDKRSRALLWPMRSGKSRACIDVACYQFKRKQSSGTIVIAPNGVHLNWARNEIPTWGHKLQNHYAFAWETQKRGFPEKQRQWKRLMAHPGHSWLCLNMDALKHPECRVYLKEFIHRKCNGRFTLLVSEAHHFGRAGAKRTYFARSLATHARYVRTETGTPILTGPLRAFSQFELLGDCALGFKKYKHFEEHYAEFEPGRPGERNYRKVKGYKNLDELTEHIAKWSSLVLREDLHGMPSLLRIDRPVVMSDKQRRAYLEMVTHHLTEIGNEQVTAKEGGARMMKLQQIVNGWLRNTESGETHTVDDDAPIFTAVLDEIRGTMPGKALVWCRYKEDIRRIAERLRKRGVSYLEYHGDIAMVERENNRHQFNRDPFVDVMLGTPDAGGEGLDFSGADAVIFFSANPNARLMAQAEERATVLGGRTVTIVRLRTYGTVDDRLWDIVDTNTNLADTITGHGLRDLLIATDV